MKYLLFIFLFLLLFGFQINGFNTRYLALLGQLGLFLFYPSKLKKMKHFILDRFVFSNFLICILICLLPIIVSSLHQTNDFSLLVDSVGILIIYIGAVIWTFWFLQYSTKEVLLLKCVINVMLVQSIIILSCVVSPDIYLIIRGFQYENISEVAEKYLTSGVLRGLALAGDQFFGLASLYGFVYLFGIRYMMKCKSLGIFLIFMILFFATSFVGRTSYLGLLASLVIFFFSTLNYSKRMYFKYILIFMSLLFVTYSIFLPADLIDLLNENVFPYAFELFYNWFNGNGLHSASSDQLIDMLSINIDLSTYIIGDGRFVGINGGYYRRTDSGYLRLFLYGGFFYIVTYVLAIYYLFFKGRTFARNTNDKIFIVSLFLFFAVLQIKGMAFYYSRESMILLFIYFIYIHFLKKEELISYE